MKTDELIAKFMGYTPHGTWFQNITHHWVSPEGIIILETEFEYHTSWDWLMPAIQKFFSLNFEDAEWEQENQFIDYCSSISEKLLEINIDECCRALIEGIKWYNSQKK